jgi:Flp pilus assembly protein TadG
MVFFMMVFAIFEAGRLFFEYSIVAHAAEEGARYGSMHGSACVTLLKTSCQLTGDDVKTYVQDQWPAFDVTVTPATLTSDGSTTIEVTVSGTFEPLFWFFADIPTITYSNTAKMLIAN